MFGIGTSELLIIFVIALLILGPKEIPKLARTLGRGMRELQRAKDDLRQTIDTEAEMEEVAATAANQKKEAKKPEPKPAPSEDEGPS
ncbi:MAG: Sec-independent protein translocase protein TatB [Deltaproteobacteria bacterium]